MDAIHDVAIIGAGPVGLTLALGLAQRGVDAIVLERDDDTAEHSRAPAIWPPTQRILADLGVLEFGAEAVEVVQDFTGVTVRYCTGSGEQELRARFVAGCDGVSSRVRELIGASFDGVTYDARAALADLRLSAWTATFDTRGASIT
jgi:2-polyprenyl-6-methoxyphenol hydroxylase-like FAD-dependent oxidoreductase